VELSNAEAHDFWRWRSDQYDASFLSMCNEDDIKEYFRRWLMVKCEEHFLFDENGEVQSPYDQ
jgi:hypothetical protein